MILAGSGCRAVSSRLESVPVSPRLLDPLTKEVPGSFVGSFARFFVNSSLFKAVDHSWYARRLRTKRGKCVLACVNGAQVYRKDQLLVERTFKVLPPGSVGL